MDRPITTRLPEEFVLKIQELAKKENLDTSAVIRRLLARSLKDEREKSVLEAIDNHKMSIGRAAKELNISLWDVLDLAKRNNINWTGYDEEELEHDLEIIGLKR